MNANGAYINYLKLDKVIIMPTFNDPENDNEAKRRLETVFRRPVETIEADELAKK